MYHSITQHCEAQPSGARSMLLRICVVYVKMSPVGPSQMDLDLSIISKSTKARKVANGRKLVNLLTFQLVARFAISTWLHLAGP